MRDPLRRTEKAALDSGDHIPAPLEHRGPDNTTVFEDNGILYCVDWDDAAERWLAYSGCITEVVN